MRAVRLHEFGKPLQLDEVDEPVPGEGEALLEVAYAAVNPLDVWVTRGSFGSATPLPLVPGVEATGHLDGRPVLVRGAGLGVSRDGLYRKRANVPAKAAVPLPEDLDLAQAAALGVAGLTAWRVARDLAPVGPDDRVLVLGASGGVGSLVVQLAKGAGATVWGQTSNEAKADFVAGDGADRAVVAPTGAALRAALGEDRPTVVFDALGGEFTAAAVGALAPKGRLVIYGTSSDPEATLNLRELYRKGTTVLTYTGLQDPPEQAADALRRLFAELGAGRLKVTIDDVLALEDAAEAHRRIVEREVRGKLLLRP